jgi:hypothetical protein
LKLSGVDYFNTQIIVRVKNEGFTKFFYNSVNFTNSLEVRFKFPIFDEFNVGYNFSYPTIFEFGLSFDGGYSYTQKNLIYLDKFVFLIIYFVNPNLVQRTNNTLSLRGLGLRFADKCIFRKTDSTLIYSTNVTTFGADDRVLCELYPSATVGLNAMKISIRNIFNDTSNEKQIDLYSKKKCIELT